MDGFLHSHFLERGAHPDQADCKGMIAYGQTLSTTNETRRDAGSRRRGLVTWGRADGAFQSSKRVE